MSLLDNTYINDEQVPTIGERNLSITYSVKTSASMPIDMYFKYQDIVVDLVHDIKAGHSLKARYLEPLIRKYFSAGSYKFNIQTNFRTMVINIDALINIFDCDHIAKITIQGIDNGAGYN